MSGEATTTSGKLEGMRLLWSRFMGTETFPLER